MRICLACVKANGIFSNPALEIEMATSRQYLALGNRLSVRLGYELACTLTVVEVFVVRMGSHLD
jgi:hypothetical protein